LLCCVAAQNPGCFITLARGRTTQRCDATSAVTGAAVAAAVALVGLSDSFKSPPATATVSHAKTVVHFVSFFSHISLSQSHSFLLIFSTLNIFFSSAYSCMHFSPFSSNPNHHLQTLFQAQCLNTFAHCCLNISMPDWLQTLQSTDTK